MPPYKRTTYDEIAMPVEALIFDLDGTLVDTAPDLMGATNHALSLINRRPIGMDEVRHMVGHGARALIERGCAATGDAPDDATLNHLHKAFLDYYAHHIADHSVMFPGLMDVLHKARDVGLKLGVCTNKVEGLSHKLLAALKINELFGAVVGGDTLPIMKPDPAPYREVAKLLSVDAANTIMFGDSETDILTAQNTGVPVVAVTFGYTPKPVQTYNPTHVISHYDQAWPIISQYL
jgi:phosphoglycolate phosphatase